MKLDQWSMRWLIRLLFSVFYTLHAIAYAMPENELLGAVVFAAMTEILPSWVWVVWFTALAAVVGHGMHRRPGSCSRVSGFISITLGSATLAFMVSAAVLSTLNVGVVPSTLISYPMFLGMFIWCAATTIWPKGL